MLVGCAEEPPPRSVGEFMDNPILLEAALVRCTQNRAETRYDAECVNAREAVKLIEAKEEAARREELEAQSQRKREALRRTQQAAAEARRRAAEAQRQREEAEYLAQFGELPPGTEDRSLPSGNAPLAVIPDPVETQVEPEPGVNVTFDAPPPSGNAPTAEVAPQPVEQAVQEPVPEEQAPANDLASIRDELKRRNEDGNQPQ